MSNTYVEAETWGTQEILEEVRRGIYMMGSKGGEVDTATGTFTFGAKEDYLIENWGIKGHLMGVGLSGSIHEVLAGIKAIGRE
ncbi:metallopeptidase TldD-related protein [Thermococcus sp.]